MRKRRQHQRYGKAKPQEDKAFLEIAEHKSSPSYSPHNKKNQGHSLTITQLKEQRKKQDQSGHNLQNISLNSGNITSHSSLQPKLTIQKQEDRQEKEANTVASQVVSQIDNSEQINQQQDISPEKQQSRQRIYPANNLNPSHNQSNLDQSIQQARMRGENLDAKIRLPMEKAFGVDFREVKIHHDSQSDSLNKSLQAKAFTTGKDVFFRQGQFNYGNKSGQELIAHELTHVIQQQNQPMIQCQSEELVNKESIQLRQNVEGEIKRWIEGVDSFYYIYDNELKYLKDQLVSESIPNQEAIRPNLNLQALNRFILEQALDKLTSRAPMTQAIDYRIEDVQEKWWQESLQNLQTQGEMEITNYLDILIKKIELQKEEILKLIDKGGKEILTDFDNNDQQANFVKYLQEGVSAFKDEIPDPSALRQEIFKAFKQFDMDELEF